MLRGVLLCKARRAVFDEGPVSKAPRRPRGVLNHTTDSAARNFLAQLFTAAVNAARGDRVIPTISRVEGGRWVYAGPGGSAALELPANEGRVIVVGAGKAAVSMASGMESVLGDRIDHGLVIVKQGGAGALRRIECREGAHPVPDATSVEATHALLRLVDSARPQDVVFFLLSGGASSLLCMPIDSVPFDDKALANRLLVTSGAAIAEINVVRKHLSDVKGGRLRRRCRAETFCTLAISDVIGDDPSTIGSGPSVPDPSTFHDALAIIERYGLSRAMPHSVLAYLRQGVDANEPHVPAGMNDCYRIVAGNRTALDAAASLARARGCVVDIVTDRMAGSTHEAARNFAHTLRQLAAKRSAGTAPLVVLAGGETTVQVQGRGMGGRNQEFAIVAGLALQGMSNITLLAAGSDGTDGPTDVAGAFADTATLARSLATGSDVHAHLADNDAYPLLDRMGDLYRSGPTGTNVMDLVAAVIGGP